MRLLVDRLGKNDLLEASDCRVRLAVGLVEAHGAQEQVEIQTPHVLPSTRCPFFAAIVWEEFAPIESERRLVGGLLAHPPRDSGGDFKGLHVDPEESRATQHDGVALEAQVGRTCSPGKIWLEEMSRRVQGAVQVVGGTAHCGLGPQRILDLFA